MIHSRGVTVRASLGPGSQCDGPCVCLNVIKFQSLSFSGMWPHTASSPRENSPPSRVTPRVGARRRRAWVLRRLAPAGSDQSNEVCSSRGAKNIPYIVEGNFILYYVLYSTTLTMCSPTDVLKVLPYRYFESTPLRVYMAQCCYCVCVCVWECVSTVHVCTIHAYTLTNIYVGKHSYIVRACIDPNEDSDAYRGYPWCIHTHVNTLSRMHMGTYVHRDIHIRTHPSLLAHKL